MSLYGTVFQIANRVSLTYLLAGSLGLISVCVGSGRGWSAFLVVLEVLFRREKKKLLQPAPQRAEV